MEKFYFESDWKLFRELIVDWQEAYMGKLIEDYKEYLNSDELPSTKFWGLVEIIKKDKPHPGVIVERKRSKLIFNLVNLIDNDVISVEDLVDFSEELQDVVLRRIHQDLD